MHRDMTAGADAGQSRRRTHGHNRSDRAYPNRKDWRPNAPAASISYVVRLFEKKPKLPLDNKVPIR